MQGLFKLTDVDLITGESFSGTMDRISFSIAVVAVSALFAMFPLFAAAN